MPKIASQTKYLIVCAGVTFMFCTWAARTDSSSGVEQHSTLALPRQGNLAMRSGTPTVRRPYIAPDDDPGTSNDESNDQPVGHFGTLTLSVCNLSSGKCYDVDGELSGTTLERLYFPKGGWVDFDECELEDDFTGQCDDENGTTWDLNGES